jgi:hypothetical protein
MFFPEVRVVARAAAVEGPRSGDMRNTGTPSVGIEPFLLNTHLEIAMKKTNE